MEFEKRLKSLDMLGLFFTLILGIVKVTTISERSEQGIRREASRNILQRLKRIQIPIYSKALFLLYLATINFYMTLEAHTISVILTIQNNFRLVKIRSLMVSSPIGFIFIFWRYKPFTRKKSAKELPVHY